MRAGAGFHVIAAAAALAAALSFAGPARALDHVEMATAGTSSDVSVFIASKKGFFADEGLDVAMTPFDTGVKMIAPLGTGELDAATSSGNAALYNAVGRGIGLKIVVSSGNAPAGYGHNLLIVRGDLIASGRYKSPRDIKGMKIAMPSTGSSATATLANYLRGIGLKFEDIEPVYLSYPNTVAALANGAIDAGLTAEPSASQAITAGYATRVTSDDVMDPGHEASVTLMSGKFINERPDAARRFMRAFIKGARFYNDALKDGLIAGPNADEVVSILTEYTAIKDPAIYRAIAPQGVDPNGRLNVAGLQKDLDFYRTQGWIEGGVSAAQAVDLRMTEAAVRELGPYVAKSK